MASKATSTFVRWSEHVPASDVQDPLGLELRGSARLAQRLLFCITSVTPRARYFSFLPWCIQDWQKREKGRPADRGLRQGIVFREKALTYGAVAHHGGASCAGGALVGSTRAQHWLEKGPAELDLRKIPFAKNPALGVYFNSLVNLGMFQETGDCPETDDDEDDDERPETRFDDVELSALGKQVADAYSLQVGRLACVRDLSQPARRCSVRSLGELGKRGGLCELMAPQASDRELLRDIFLARIGPQTDSHKLRRRSLLLLLELCRQLAAAGWSVDETAFGQSVYYDQCHSAEQGPIDIVWPAPLRDIATRWRMFYFHQYMSIALEGLFAWVVTQAAQRGVAGVSFDQLVDQLNSPVVTKTLSELFERPMPPAFGDSTPADIIRLADSQFTELDAASSRRLTETIPIDSPISEERLAQVIRDGTFLYDPAGLAIPMVLLSVTLMRYVQWEDTRYGDWLASSARDPYLDLLPPILSMGLNRRSGRWWSSRLSELAEYVIRRQVVQQHQSLSYEKTIAGDRCLLQVDGQRVMSDFSYDAIGMHNPRFRSALRILEDLTLIAATDDNPTDVTPEGRQILENALAETETA
jgi:hypothetical protein